MELNKNFENWFNLFHVFGNECVVHVVVEGRLQRLVLDLHQVDQTRNVFWSPENLPNFVGKPEKNIIFKIKQFLTWIWNKNSLTEYLFHFL